MKRKPPGIHGVARPLFPGPAGMMVGMEAKKPPDAISGARLLRYSVIDERHRHTGKCRHVVGGKVAAPAFGLAICQYAGEAGFYLFGCDEHWESVTDTWHQ